MHRKVIPPRSQGNGPRPVIASRAQRLSQPICDRYNPPRCGGRIGRWRQAIPRPRRSRIVALGGLGEIGLNLMAIECAGRAIVIDCGVMFPDEPALGLGTYVPEMAWLERATSRSRRSCSRMPTRITSARCRICCAASTFPFTEPKSRSHSPGGGWPMRNSTIRSICGRSRRASVRGRAVHGRADSGHALDAQFARARDSNSGGNDRP